MEHKITEIKKGIKIHEIQTNKFKTNLLAVFLSLPLERDTVTKNALVTAVLRRGTKNMNTQEKISKHLEEMYGAGFDCGVEKSGDTNTIKFYLEVINNKFLPEKEDLLKESLNMLFDIVFNPYVENESFKEEYVKSEKENLKQIIEGKIDNKDLYALERCIEEMYKGEPYGLYKYGYIEDLKDITAKDLYSYYKEMIQKCKIDIFISGDLKEEVINDVQKNEHIDKLNERNEDILNTENSDKNKENVKEITDNMQVTQGKLILGLTLSNKIDSYASMIYNTILGVGANSKLFQNVREKESLAYYCSSNYVKRKQIIMIRSGIEIENKDKALKIIEEQLSDMENGKFAEEDIQNAKNLILETIDNITEEQDTQISYYFGQELAKSNISIEEYRNKVENIAKEQIIEIAKNVKINTIYFLRD